MDCGPKARAEARHVAGWLAARAIPHEILVWAGDKPASGIQEAAREARYRLLGEWCRAHGCLHLLTAHHREDQVETHLIRRRAGSGVDGLAAMSAVRELPGCRLVRPLLSVPRARLLALLAAEGQPFLRDPSNLNPAFERVRLRAAADASGWRDARRHCCRAARLRGISGSSASAALDRLIARAVALHPAGFAALDPAAARDGRCESAERLLGRVAACIGGARYPARRARLARLRTGLDGAPRSRAHARRLPVRAVARASPGVARAGRREAPARLEPGAHLSCGTGALSPI